MKINTKDLEQLLAKELALVNGGDCNCVCELVWSYFLTTPVLGRYNNSETCATACNQIGKDFSLQQVPSSCVNLY